MNTIFYLIRHSIRLKKNDIESLYSNQSNLINNEKISLSIDGEKRAEILSKISELQNVSSIYSSNCVRTIQTAKYLLNELGLKLNLDERFDERRVGIENADEYPDWLQRQYTDIDYSTINGESQRMVVKRFDEALMDIIKKHAGEEIAVFTHGYAISFFLLKYFKFACIDENHWVKLLDKNDKVVLDKRLDSPEVFKITLNEKLDLIDFKNIIVDYGEIKYNYNEAQ